MRLSKLLVLLAIIIGLCGCSPERRFAHWLKKHPEFIKTDTVWKKDTVTIYGTQTDTVLKIFQRDTVVIKKDQLTLKYYMRSDSTIYLSGKCDTVQIIREIPVMVNSVQVKDRTGWEIFWNFVYNNWFGVVLLLLFLIYLWRNKKSKS